MNSEPTTTFAGHLKGFPLITCFRGEGRYQVGDLVATSLLGLRAKWLSGRLSCRGNWYRRGWVARLGWDSWVIVWVPISDNGPLALQTPTNWVCQERILASGLVVRASEAPQLEALLEGHYQAIRIAVGAALVDSLPRIGNPEATRGLHPVPIHPALMADLSLLEGSWLEPI